MNSTLKFFGIFSVFLLFVLASCGGGDNKKCSEDEQCKIGSYCSTEKNKCTDFAENDYKIEITSLEDGAHLCGKVEVAVTLGEVSEKLHDGMKVALTVEKGRDMETFEGAFSEAVAFFELDLSEVGVYKIAAFLVQNPFEKAEITVTCDSEPEPVDDTDTDTNTDNDTDTAPADEDHDTPVDDADSEPVSDGDTDTAPADEDHETQDEDNDNTEPEAKPVAEILSHPQDVSSLATAEFTFESDIEEATFRCKLDANEWESCTSPKVYENLTEGDHTFSLKAVNVGGTESDVVSFSWKIDFSIANIDILAPWNSDKAGDGEADTCKANNYGAKVKDSVIYVGTTQDAIESEENFGVCFKVGFANTAAGAKFNVYRKNGEGWDELHTGTLSAADVESAFIMLSGFKLNKGENTMKVVVGGKSEDVADAEYIQKIVVATTSPEIAWAFPLDNKIFSQSTFSSGIFATFDIANSIPELEVELFEGDSSVASLKIGRFGAESLSFKDPELADSCSARAFHAVLYDTLNGKIVDSGNRTITFDVNAPSIDALSIAGRDGSAITSAVNASQNPVTVSVNLSDAANVAGDGNRTVTLYTNGGSGTPNKVLAKRENAGTEVVFENIELSEAKHTLKVEIKDCTGNISSSVLDPVTVSLKNPVLTVVSPKGKGDDSRWLVLSDVEHLEGASVSGGTLNGVKMHIVSDKVLSSVTQVSHVFGSDQVDITENAVLTDGYNITIDLPNLENGRHKFIVNVLDFAGNPGKIGGGDEEYYEVDVVSPTINSLVFHTENYPVKMTIDLPNAAPETSYTLVTTKGESVKTWHGVITENGVFEKTLQLSKGEWSADLTLTDDHGNVTASVGNAFEVTHDVPEITLKKADGVTVMNVTHEAKPVWFGPTELESCAESSCVTIRIYAPEGTEVSYGIGSSTGSVTIGTNGYETITVQLSLDSVSTLVINDGSGYYSETYYLAATDRTPSVSVSNPVVCPKSAEYCSIYELSDDLSTEDVIELAELGFGYDDDLTPGDGILNFKTGSAIKFVIQNSPTGGFMEIENAPAGFEYVRVPLVKMQGDAIPENYYTADFSNLTVPDTNANGQSDYDLVFVLTTESGFTQRLNVPLHVDLDLPGSVSAAASASTADALLGKLNFSWDPAAKKPYAYEVRYQSYDEGTCSIVDEFDNATVPLIEFAGKITKPLDTQMSYNFFVNAVTNAAGTLTADIHKNGNSYCAAVAAVNAVLADDGRVMAKNYGSVDAGSVKDFGTVKMNWTNIYETSSGYHNFRLKIIGDVDNDGFDDYAIANRHKSDSGTDTERNGFVDIYSGAGHTLIRSIRGILGSNERLGQDISSKADLNGDGSNDFAYTNQYGEIFVFFGTENGIDFEGTPVTFTAKDASSQVNRGLVTGDYNGDGCGDILVSAPSKNVGSFSKAGEVYVYFGCKEGGFVGEEPDLTFQGNAKDAKLGQSGIMAVGDLNNDGNTDFAFGSANALYIIYGGSPEGFLAPKFTLSANSNPGLYMSKGDFNGDGIGDFVYNVTSESRIFYGSDSGIKSTPDLRLNNFSALYDNYGPYPTYNVLAVATEAQDLNGDGADDLVITSSTGILIYYTYTDTATGKKQLKAQPSIFDGFAGQTGTDSKVMMLDDALIFCNNDKAAGNCERLEF